MLAAEWLNSLLQEGASDTLAAGHALVQMFVPIGCPGDQGLAGSLERPQPCLT